MDYHIGLETVVYLRYAHGAFNLSVAAGFFVQACVGLRIRRARISGLSASALQKAHRRFGPALAAFGLAGFLSGMTVIYLDKGHILEYPIHFAFGAGVAGFIVTAFSFSRMIRSLDPAWRVRHMIAGIALLWAYLFQMFLGLAVLL